MKRILSWWHYKRAGKYTVDIMCYKFHLDYAELKREEHLKKHIELKQ